MGAPPPPPPYVMLNGQGSSYGGRYSSGGYDKRSGRSSCLKCICCCYCTLFFVVFILAALTVYFYTAYEPKVPTYKLQGLDVKAFDVQPDFSLNTVFVVNVEAENPNKAIGFTYGSGSSVVVEYTDSVLCSGAIPIFHQPPANVTVFPIELSGRSEYGSGLQEALDDSKKKGRIPLLVKIQVPVNVVVGKLTTRQILVFVNCTLVVDQLAAHKKINILSSTYNFDYKL